MQERNFIFNHRNLKAYLRDEADESVFAEIFKLREYRVAEDIIRSAIDPIIDIGAHSGLFTLYARALNPTARLVAVEPEANNLSLLKQHLAENQVSEVEIVGGALAEKTGKRKLLISSDTHNHRLIDSDMSVTGADVQIVPAYSLKDLFKKFSITRASLIKMDIEGGEYEVIEGMKAEDYKIFDALVMEYHDSFEHSHQEVENTLRENGFGAQIFPSKFDKKMGFIFAKNKRLKIS